MLESFHLKRPTINEYGQLCCPSCNSSNLHSEQTEVYARTEDAVTVAVKTIQTSTPPTVLIAAAERNTSPRRDATSIFFSCEGCDSMSELTILQHKGSTYCGWYQNPNSLWEKKL
jgi:hypothetical protein